MYKRITNPLRFGIFILAMIALCVVLSITFLHADKEYRTKNICVKPGDTVWSIASSQSHDTIAKDIREYVYIICKENNTNGMIYPGQILTVPVD